MRALLDLSEDVTWRYDDVLALSEHASLIRTTNRGRDRASGGAWERPICSLRVHDADGLICRWEIFEAEQEAEALARYDALVAGSGEAAAPPPSEPPFANAATATVAPVIAAMIAHDWQRFAQLFAGDFRCSDRRRVVQLELDRDQYIAFTREVADGRTIRAESELLATRGDRLALTRPTYEFSDADVGPSEIAFLILTEVDARGRIAAYVRWDIDDLDAAYAELDARFEAGEGAPHTLFMRSYQRAFASRDWDAIAALYPPTFVEHDHRAVAVLGTTHGAEAWMQDRVLVELAPDTVVRLDHVRLGPHGRLFQVTWLGSRDGARYEIPFVVVTKVDELGRQQRSDLYDPEQIDQARARFAELAAPAETADRFANAATRALDRGTAALGARDWEGFAALFAAEFRVYDRTSFAQFESDAAEWLAGFRPMVEMTSGTPTRQVLATRGDRLALGRVLWRGAAGDVGPSEVEWLLIIEVDDCGDHLAVVSFNPNDLGAAWAELDARWRAGEGAEYGTAATYLEGTGPVLARRDWDAAAARYASTLVAHDHRLVSWGTLQGPAAFLEAFRAMFALAPDARFRTDHLRATRRGFIADCVWLGTRDGGAFESPFLIVAALDSRGRMERLDFYDPHRLDAAYTRFDEINASAPDAPLASMAKRNAAAAAMDRWQAAYDTGFDAGDWDAMRGLCAPRMIFDDRRRLALLCGDRELMIASARERVAIGARPARRLVGTAGERVAVERILWSGGPSDGRFEIEYLGVFEIDEAGLFTAMILFEVDDARAAQREAWTRWAAIEPDVAPNVALLARTVDAFNAHDLGAYLATVADDVLVVDHRRTGMGRLEGADAYAASTEALWSLAPGTTAEAGWHWPAYGRHGVMTVVRRYGTLADGGAYESEYLQLFVQARGRFTNIEMFELEDLAAALAHFAELSAARTT